MVTVIGQIYRVFIRYGTMRNVGLEQRPEVSVVVPALNEEHEIVHCLASLARQTIRGFEVIVVDNGSKDATVSIAQAWGASTINEPRQGISYAREKGFLAAPADIIASTDADTVVPPNWLERIHRTFAETPEAVAVFGPYRYKSPPTPISMSSLLIPYFSRGLMIAQRLTWKFGHPYFSGANFAVRREAFLKVDGFRSLNNGQIYSDWEDVQLGIKLYRLGKICYLPDLIVLTSARKLTLVNARHLLTGTPRKALRVQFMGKAL